MFGDEFNLGTSRLRHIHYLVSERVIFQHSNTTLDTIIEKMQLLLLQLCQSQTFNQRCSSIAGSIRITFVPKVVGKGIENLLSGFVPLV